MAIFWIKGRAVTDTESERSVEWPDGTFVSCKDTKNSYILLSGVFYFVGNNQGHWTYVKLANDFSTTSATAVDITGLSFAPSANTRYEFEARLMVRTATATVNPRPGLAWPTGISDGVANLWLAQSATAQLLAFGNPNASILMAVGGLPNTNQSWPAGGSGIVSAGATPSGSLRLQLASETNGTSVTAKAGSFLKYRTL